MAPAGARRQARERALGLLYEAEVKGQRPGELVAELPVSPDPYVLALLEGVELHAAEIDRLLGEHAVGWQVERMPAVDRNVLRMATYELIGEPGTPTAVVLSEAVELAKQYSTEDSGRFVNGVLASLARLVRPVPSSAGG
ncbi:MAG: transcription antitermination factor NusB [Actinomycetota bacterium]|nr:transcription antitermination factor NusB [Actinomycetota bacterium]